MRGVTSLVLLLGAVLTPRWTLGQDSERRRFTPEDIHRIRDVRELAIAPDGDWVAYTVRSTDIDSDRRNADLFMVSWDGATRIQLTHSDGSEASPRFSPDGNYLAFITATVARLLKKMHFSLRGNQKRLAGASPDERDSQFAHIADLRESFAAEGLPVISVDTKKRELVGCFKNSGVAWDREPVPVNDHDFRSDAIGIAIPYGVYDVQANRGTVFVGTTYDTPFFAVDAIEKWWRTEGQHRYRDAGHLAILADGGGSNSATSRVWKYGLQTRVCDRHRLNVTDPSGASKWNPIEHRRNQQKLGCPPTGQLRPSSNTSAPQPQPPGTGSRTPRPQGVQERRQDHPRPDGRVGPDQRRGSAQVELHPAACLKVGSYSFADT